MILNENNFLQQSYQTNLNLHVLCLVGLPSRVVLVESVGVYLQNISALVKFRSKHIIINNCKDIQYIICWRTARYEWNPHKSRFQKCLYVTLEKFMLFKRMQLLSLIHI